jgi:hypothetical protein
MTWAEPDDVKAPQSGKENDKANETEVTIEAIAA